MHPTSGITNRRSRRLAGLSWLSSLRCRIVYLPDNAPAFSQIDLTASSTPLNDGLAAIERAPGIARGARFDEIVVMRAISPCSGSPLAEKTGAPAIDSADDFV